MEVPARVCPTPWQIRHATTESALLRARVVLTTQQRPLALTMPLRTLRAVLECTGSSRVLWSWLGGTPMEALSALLHEITRGLVAGFASGLHHVSLDGDAADAIRIDSVDPRARFNDATLDVEGRI